MTSGGNFADEPDGAVRVFGKPPYVLLRIKHNGMVIEVGLTAEQARSVANDLIFGAMRLEHKPS